MKFKVGLVVEEEHLGHVLAAMHKFHVAVVGVEALNPPVPQLAHRGKHMKDVTPKSEPGKRNRTLGNLTAQVYERIKTGPISSKDAVAMAQKIGKTNQAGYGALNTLMKQGKIQRVGGGRFGLVVQPSMELSDG